MMATTVRYRWEPEARNATIGHGVNRATMGRAGDVVYLDPDHAARVCAIVPGVGGAPCLIAIADEADPPAAPAADTDTEAKRRPRRRRRAGKD